MAHDASTMGAPVSDGPARFPSRVVLEGRCTRLEPLDAGHGEALWEATRGSANDHIWTYLADGPYASRADLDAALKKKAAAADAVFFAILVKPALTNPSAAALTDPSVSALTPSSANALTRPSSVALTRPSTSALTRPSALGYASYMRIDPPNRVIEVGNVLFSPPLQGTTAATEAMYLMAKHAFEDLGYRRYEWKCNDLNAPSKRAAVRLGFTFEGVFRQHMIVKGRNRDTAWYSMLDSEWPAVKARFERWLDPSNFDEDGRQKKRLKVRD